MAFSIKKEYTINAPIDAVWKALTNSKTLSSWQGQKCAQSTKVGGHVSLFDGATTGKILVFEPKKKLSYTWRQNTWDASWADSLVTYTLKEKKDKTTVVLSHTKLPNKQEVAGHKEGWDGYFFDLLKEFVEA
ncbi:hypothetical protein COT72_00955 [archaeon CG10_big_fil_rev_8_21_14_0_10_43_11]|nr:MAG: hypothetical protein COT72_00955 [archaeon CG10_big_fil_rev_8_21_14_0_10_43_11]